MTEDGKEESDPEDINVIDHDPYQEDDEIEFNMDDFGSRLQMGEDDDYDDEADPFGAIFDDDEIIDKDSNEDKPSDPSKAHRGTFVGTPLYASPEMLNDSVSGPFTDLWALGVIVY